MDSDLRGKISDSLPSIEDQENAAATVASEATAAATAAAATAAAAPAGGGGRDEATTAGAAGENGGAASVAGAPRVTLTPGTLARALPHIRRLAGSGQAGSVRGTLGLLRGGGLVFPETQAAAAAAAMKQTEEKRAYAERRERLLLLQEQREYQRMTSNIQRAPRETVRDIQATFKFQAGMGANMIVAMFTTFIICYWASKFIVGTNKSHRLVIGLVGAMFIMLVELMVFVVRSLKADEVLETARQNAEESHTAVGVHRLAPRPGEQMGSMEPMSGRGVLEQTRKSSSRGRGGGEYELVATREQGDERQEGAGGELSGAAPGIRRVVG